MRTRSTASATALALLLALGSSSLATCAGWQLSAEARKACCAAAGHECGDADDCCAGGEEQQTGRSGTAGVVMVLPDTSTVAAFEATASAGAYVRSVDGSRPIAPPVPTYLFLSVFLV